MPRLISTKGARDVFVPDEDTSRWQGLINSGDYRVADGETASVVDPYGHQTVVGQDVLATDQAKGVANTYETQEKIVKRGREKRLEDQTSTAGAFTRNLGSAVSFGVTDALVDDETLEADQLHHGTASFLGQAVGLGGSLLLGNDMGLAKLLGGAAEARGVSAGVRELATTGDALTAEHVGSALSSNAVLGGGAELSGAERALGRAGKAIDEGSATRAGLASVPEDLVGLDAAGLRRAAAEEKAALKASADAEKVALEDARKAPRAQIADEVKAMHQELMAERPIFTAVAGDDVRKLEGVKDIASQMNRSYKGLRSKLDNPIRIAENPDLLVGDLQMRQAALESLQAKTPEIRALLGDDARAAALEHVPAALEQTKQQIAAIQAVSKSTPVASERLATLTSGTSERLSAIEAAQEALKAAPETGLMQKGAQAGAFAGVTALAHAIPGVGIMAPFAGKWASDAVGKVFEHLAAAKANIAERSGAALEKFLDTAAKVTSRVTPAAAGVTAAQILAQVRFGSGGMQGEAEPVSVRGDDLAKSFRARSAEIRQQTMYAPDGSVQIRPEARQDIRARLDAVFQVNPVLGDHLETLAVRKTEYVSATMPRQPEAGGLQIGPDNWKPSSLAMRQWARVIQAAEDPGSVEDDLANGVVTPEAAKAYRNIYPERFAALQSEIWRRAPSLSKSLPMQKKVALSIFTGIPVTPAMQPRLLAVLQASFRAEPGSAGGMQAPTPQPAFGAFGSLPSQDKTAAQRSQEP